MVALNHNLDCGTATANTTANSNDGKSSGAQSPFYVPDTKCLSSNSLF